MNKVILVGRLTRDPEVTYTETGKALCKFNIAVDSGFGENKKADFIPIVVWDKLAEVCGNNLTKGRRVLVEGRLQIRNYEKDGVKRRSADVVAQGVEFLDTRQTGQGAVSSPGTATGNQPNNAAAGGQKSVYDMTGFGTEVFPEEEIPF